MKIKNLWVTTTTYSNTVIPPLSLFLWRWQKHPSFQRPSKSIGSCHGGFRDKNHGSKFHDHILQEQNKVIFPFGKEIPLFIGWKGETIRHNFARYPNNRAQLPPGCSLRFGTWLFVLAVLLAPKSRASQVEIPIELASFHASHSAVPSQTQIGR